MADEFKVDLSKIEDVRRHLNSLLGQMDSVSSDVTYQTTIGEGYLGGREDRFLEAAGLREAHAQAKESINAIVTHLTNLINTYGTKTATVQGAYQDSDATAKSSMAQS